MAEEVINVTLMEVGNYLYAPGLSGFQQVIDDALIRVHEAATIDRQLKTVIINVVSEPAPP